MSPRLAYLFDDGEAAILSDDTDLATAREGLEILFDEDDGAKLVEVELTILREIPLTEPN